ncbi:MAG: M66 family metalloprotease [Polyangiaceae bacterium]
MRSRKLSLGLAALACILSLAGCDASGGGGYATNGAPESCSAAPACWERCVCSTGDEQACLAACDGQGGAGGGWPTGDGGSGATSPGVGGNGGGAGTDSPPSSTGGTTGSAGSGGSPNPPEPEPQPVAGLDLLEISAWQSVKIKLMREGQSLTDNLNAPVVAGRDALLRVYVQKEPEWEQRAVEAKLYIDGVEQGSQTFTPGGDSNAGDLSSSINFQVPGNLLTTSAKFSVALFELDQSQHAGTQSGSRYPADGDTSFGASEVHGAFKVTLVPVTINGYTPDTSSDRIEAYRGQLRAMFPIADIELNVRESVNYGGNVTASSGWGNLLDSIQALRQDDNPAPNTYYYGLLTPAPSMGSFCSGGCTAGLGSVPGPNSDYYRGAIGLGFFPDGSFGGSPDTMAHELGHALGRPHAPCGGAGGPDANYPYSGGEIGSWGFDQRNGQPLSPSGLYDLMGYCDPSWISDYNYRLIFERVSYVNANPKLIAADPLRAAGSYASYAVSPTGELEALGVVDLRQSAMGEARSVDVVLTSGEQTQVTGYYTPYADAELGGHLLVPRRAHVDRISRRLGNALQGFMAPASAAQRLTR